MRRLLSCLAVSSLFLGLAPLASAQPFLIDHFQMYLAFGPPGVTSQMTDQFGTEASALDPLNFLLVPADKNMEGIQDEISHQTCYPLVDPSINAPNVRATHQLGTVDLSLGLGVELCLPTEKGFSPGTVSLDHYKCYEAAGPALDQTVSIRDQFGSRSATLTNPFLFCAPVDKNMEGIQNPADHLTCYQTGTLGQAAGNVPIRNQFTGSFTDIDVLEAFALCLPSAKEIVTTAPTHYSVYTATGQAGGPVNLVDQFGEQDSILGQTQYFFVPADKNGEGLGDPFTHQTCYEIPEPFPTPNRVEVGNQFGLQELQVFDPDVLCTPTLKEIDPGPISNEHWKCYDVTGPSLDVNVDWVDQFQGVGVLVQDPFLLCNPVDKNGEGIPDPDNHLVCYKTDPPQTDPAQLAISNQFFPNGLVDIDAAIALCVPSSKTVLTDPLDHYTIYDVNLGPDAPPVTVTDQFSTVTVDPGDANLFLAPTSKNDEEIFDPIGHLTCFPISEAESDVPSTPIVGATNQFGRQDLRLGRSREICVPTEKPQLSPGPTNIDHFKCYESFGDPLLTTVTLQDQFFGRSAVLFDPFLFCAPADKNGEGIANPDPHLSCYRIDAQNPVGPVDIRTQFTASGGTDLIQVGPELAFCLPSTKDIPPVVPAISPWGVALLGFALFGITFSLVARMRRVPTA